MTKRVDVVSDNEAIIKDIDALGFFFNPERDFKNLGIKKDAEKARFIKDLAFAISKGVHGNAFSILYENNDKKVYAAKIRVAKDGGGKSGGYRTVVVILGLDDFVKAYLLKISSHQAGMDDLSDAAKDFLRNQVDEICQALQGEGK